MKLLLPAPHPATFGLFLFQSIFFLTYLPSKWTSHHIPAICYCFCCTGSLNQWHCSHSFVQPDFFIYYLYNLPCTGPGSTSSRPMGIKHPKHHMRLDFRYRMLAVPHAVFGFQQGVWVISSQARLSNQ